MAVLIAMSPFGCTEDIGAHPPTLRDQIAALEQGGANPKLDRSADLAGPDANSNGVRWVAAGSVDTDLSFLSFLELYGTEIAERRMPARRVVEALDVVEHI